MVLVVGAFTPSVLLAVARRTGRLEAAELEVTETSVPSSPAQFRSMLEGDINVALTSPDNVVAYRFSPANPLGVTTDARIVSAVDRGMGLGLYARPGFTAEKLRGATVAVDVPTSGFALAMYALTESLGVKRGEYGVVALGSTPKRLQALLAAECDATMLNAGNELMAEDAGAVLLARVSDFCAPYLGTVVCVVGDEHLASARTLALALRGAARAMARGETDLVALEEAQSVLGLSREQAHRYLQRLKSAEEGLVLEEQMDLSALGTVVELRRRYLPCLVDGVDVLEHALAPQAGLVAAGQAGA